MGVLTKRGCELAVMGEFHPPKIMIFNVEKEFWHFAAGMEVLP